MILVQYPANNLPWGRYNVAARQQQILPRGTVGRQHGFGEFGTWETRDATQRDVRRQSGLDPWGNIPGVPQALMSGKNK